MTRALLKEELGKFYTERKIIYSALSCAINIYGLNDKFVFQYISRLNKEGIIELVCDTVIETYDLAEKTIKQILNSSMLKNVDACNSDLLKIEELKQSKEIAYLDDFTR